MSTEKLKSLSAFQELLEIMDRLRSECPWDKKQTFESLRELTIEETYELSDAIIEKDPNEIKKELGDLLLHIVFYSKIGSETNLFDITEVINSINEKLIFRHPHIYKDTVANDEETVKKNWEELKLKEGNSSVLEGVPKSLPSLIKAARIQEKASGVGFDWENPKQVWKKVKEELLEFEDQVSDENGLPINNEKAEEEFGDLLFSLINYGRFLNIKADNALEKTNQKFIKRFQHIEKKALENNQSIKDLSLEEMEAFWQDAKTL